MLAPMAGMPLTILVGIDGSPTATLDRAFAHRPRHQDRRRDHRARREPGARRTGEATESAGADGETSRAAAVEHTAA